MYVYGSYEGHVVKEFAFLLIIVTVYRGFAVDANSIVN